MRGQSKGGARKSSGAPCVVCASGFFDPLHHGHVEYLQLSKDLGTTLIVIVNNDKQAELKKGEPFMRARERVKLLRSLACVDAVIESFDEDLSVCKTLEIVHPDIFTNGGGVSSSEIPEAEVCKRLEIRMVDGLGAKIQSSTKLIRRYSSHQNLKQAAENNENEAGY